MEDSKPTVQGWLTKVKNGHAKRCWCVLTGKMFLTFKSPSDTVIINSQCFYAHSVSLSFCMSGEMHLTISSVNASAVHLPTYWLMSMKSTLADGICVHLIKLVCTGWNEFVEWVGGYYIMMLCVIEVWLVSVNLSSVKVDSLMRLALHPKWLSVELMYSS